MTTTLGLRTAIQYVPDLARAKAWYSRAFGTEPYFDEPFYVGFNIGGFELGLDPSQSTGRAGPGGSTAYWGVADIAAAHAHFLASEATSVEPVHEVGGGIFVAIVADPFGNHIGLIQNPHFAPDAVT